ncbi:MAG: GMC family oxidoreductase [Sandaracinaceae bacterium]|nr:GMC family oxidoreductase [Sandaracinaceae bacterium]
MSGGIESLAGAARPADLAADVCVIGSGCGGATVARVLAEAGREVVVLEEGPDRTGLELTQRDAEMYDQLYMDRGGRSTDDLAISVLSARVLGGGGVINASDVVPIPHGVLAHWRRRFGLGELTDDALAPFAARALEDLSASRVEEAQINRANALLRRGAERAGLRGEVMLHNRVGCQGMGTCLIGCPLNAKRNPRFVAIPAAVAAGARFFTRARARLIEGASAEVKAVHVRTLDARGYRETGELVVRAPIVIVACNAVASAELLLRSGLGNAHVGRNLILQPQLPIVARFAEPVNAFRGIPQAYAITELEVEDHPEHGLWGSRVEAIMGTPGIVSTLMPFVGRESERMMAQYDRIAASLLLAPDAPSGHVEAGEHGRPRIRYTHADEHKARLRAAARVAARAYLAAGAIEVLVPCVPPVVVRGERDLSRLDSMSLRPASAPLLSAHQQGTLRMTGSASSGAVDPDGLVRGTRGVYAMDASIFPSSASSHTMAPILTMARYLAEKLAARSG